MTFRPSTRRILCLWFPDWPIQRRLAAQPELERSILLLTESSSRGEFVRHANGLAQQRGITVGMPVSEARSFVRPRDRLICEPVNLEHDRRGLIQLALQAERFSFCVGLEDADRPECLLLDITGLAHLFGNEASLAQRISEWLSAQRLQEQIAIAGTISQAWAVAHIAEPSHRLAILTADDQSILESFPLTMLRLSDAATLKLHRLGLQTVSQLLSLDRPALLRRFGDELLQRLDQFTGQRLELITPCRPWPRYRVERQLEEGLVHPEAIEHLSSSLLEQLLELLQPWRLGLRHLRGELRLDDRTSRAIDLRVCQATLDRRHVGDLLRLQWERISLTAALVSLSWEALEVAPLESVQGEFFDQELRDQARPYSALIDRLVSRLGQDAVVVPQVLPDPIPERSIRRRSVTQAAPETTTHQQAQRLHALDRPPVLFTKPRPIEVIARDPGGPPHVIFWNSQRWEIHRTWGPERIESGWWQDEFIRRDYYRAEATTGRRLWVYRQLQNDGWFWQGEW